ncbi:hypothetical protein H8356DRAFT_1419380 [Neocallimastix lanati (nom. inval.)]|nr:hypothetical protein H8356DRAFT_1419380 [Neocallimastix sp. JGI-2020a]
MFNVLRIIKVLLIRSIRRADPRVISTNILHFSQVTLYMYFILGAFNGYKVIIILIVVLAVLVKRKCCH